MKILIFTLLSIAANIQLLNNKNIDLYIHLYFFLIGKTNRKYIYCLSKYKVIGININMYIITKYIEMIFFIKTILKKLENIII